MESGREPGLADSCGPRRWNLKEMIPWLGMVIDYEIREEDLVPLVYLFFVWFGGNKIMSDVHAEIERFELPTSVFGFKLG